MNMQATKNFVDKFKGRTNQKFCSLKCKRCENTYNQREMSSFKEESGRIKEIINQLSKNNEIKQETIDLYNKVFNK